jgi:hypothetical protein
MSHEKKPPIDKHKLVDLRATAPAALEDVSDAAWKEFQALRSAEEQAFMPTAPISVGGAGKKTELPRPPAGSSLSLDEVMKVARRNNRACPLPQEWAALAALLNRAAVAGNTPPAAIDGGAWDVVPAMQKRLRLKEQLEWAEQRGCLSAAHALLSALPEECWLHL